MKAIIYFAGQYILDEPEFEKRFPGFSTIFKNMNLKRLVSALAGAL